MKKNIAVLFVALFCLSVISATQMQAQKGAKTATVWPAADIKWVEMKGTPPGVKITSATLWGNMEKGAYGALINLPANMSNPLHTHTATTKLVVISGTFWYQPEGGEKKMLDAGSYLSVPGGLKHTSGTGDKGCTVMQEGSGAWDMNPVEMKK